MIGHTFHSGPCSPRFSCARINVRHRGKQHRSMALAKGTTPAECLYSGDRLAGQVTARVGGPSSNGGRKLPLEPREDLRPHSGFAWGDDDRATAQLSLSLALLADTLSNDERALRLHEAFSRRVVSLFPERWTISRSRILAHVGMIEYEQEQKPNSAAPLVRDGS
jgi:hypothetical protein